MEQFVKEFKIPVEVQETSLQERIDFQLFFPPTIKRGGAIFE